MIYPFVGDFLLSPVPLQLSFNWCSHACSYCFANLNSPGRSFDLKEFQSQLKGIYSSNSLPSVLLREKYPVLISNLVDPFATSNYGIAVPVIEMLTHQKIPVAIQTRGGRGVDDVLSFLPKSVWYVSIPMLNDDIRRKVEPAAPDIPSRLELIDKIKTAGHEVVVGVNPTLSEFLPGKDAHNLLDILRKKGVHGIWVAAIHFNAKQLRVMPDRDRKNIGEDIINKGLKNARTLQQGCFDFIDGLKQYALSIGLSVEGMFDGDRNNFFRPFYSIYSKTFPTIYNFINWCHETKADNEAVYYHEFEKIMMQGLIAGIHNISPYMRCMSPQLEQEMRNEEGYKQTFRWLLQLCWNERRMKRTLERYWSFAISVNYDGKDMNYNLDEEGNCIYHFSRETFEEDFFIMNN